MNTVKFKIVDRKRYLVVFISIMIIALVVLFFNFITVTHAIDEGGVMRYVYIGAIFGVLAFVIQLKKLFTKELNFDVDELGIAIREGREKRIIAHQNIVMVKRIQAAGSELVHIYVVGKSVPELNFESNDKTGINTLLARLEQYQSYMSADRQGGLGERWTEYINQNMVQNNKGSINEARKQEGTSKKIVLIVLGVTFVVLVGFTIVPLLLEDNRGYEVRDDKVYYGDKLLEGVVPDSYRRLGADVIIDSTHVYYLGDVQTWADRTTFKILDDKLYTDKDGVYYVVDNWFSQNEIKPIEGDYDKATFKVLGNGSLYKDKNNLYHIKLRMIDNANPLEVLKIENLDIATIEQLNPYWAKDKGQVYFVTWENLRPCAEMDAGSFEVIDNKVAKDKNNVYYLTKDLGSDHVNATKKEDYAILDDADAPTFVRIKHNSYEDKNTTWTISND